MEDESAKRVVSTYLTSLIWESKFKRKGEEKCQEIY